jgi:hypothetical protein
LGGLFAGISVEKRRQYAGVGMARTSKGETFMLLNVVRDTVFAVLQAPGKPIILGSLVVCRANCATLPTQPKTPRVLQWRGLGYTSENHAIGKERHRMVTIAFILLCHKDRDAITPQAERLTSVGDRVATHFYLLSGDCMRIKSADYIHDYLDARDVDGIEIFDVFEGGWVKTGFCDERLVYRHLFNERSQAKGCYASRKVQQTLSLKRSIPSQLPVRIGSLWWCFRRQCVEAILEFIDQGKDIEWFFGATWLPDETFFQALARHFIPEVESDCRTPTITCKDIRAALAWHARGRQPRISRLCRQFPAMIWPARLRRYAISSSPNSIVSARMLRLRTVGIPLPSF